MRLLLDTHVLLWALADSEMLSKSAAAAIMDSRNAVLVSAVSIWEIAIKQGLGKLSLPAPAAEWLLPAIERVGIETLDITPRHALTTALLAPHHRDPFDRLLIAQALDESLTIVTRDSGFCQYGVAVLAA